VDKFFYKNSGLADDNYLSYRQKLMLFNFNNQYLSTTPTFYHFNVRVQSIENSSDYPKDSVPRVTSFPKYSSSYVGDDDSNVQNYGFSHRVVKIKQPSSMDVNLSEPPGDPSQTTFSIQYDKEDFNSTPLGITMGIRYNIDPYNEQTATNVTLNISPSSPGVSLVSVRSIQYFNNTGGTPFEQDISPTSPTVKVYLNADGKDDAARQWPSYSPILFNHSNVLLVVEPGYLEGNQFSVKNASSISLKCTFSDNITAREEPIHYRYIDLVYNWDGSITTIPNPNLTMPFLITAVMEVKVW